MSVVRRNGSSVVQMAVILACIAVVVISAVELLGNNTNTALQETANDVADPASLANRFAGNGNQDPSQGTTGDQSGSTGSSSDSSGSSGGNDDTGTSGDSGTTAGGSDAGGSEGSTSDGSSSGSDGSSSDGSGGDYGLCP